MKRRVNDRHGRPVRNAKLSKRGPIGGRRVKETKVARKVRNNG